MSIIFLGCTNSIPNDSLVNNKDSVSHYLNIASDTNVQARSRMFFNDRAKEILTRLENDSVIIEKIYFVAKNYQELNNPEEYKRTMLFGVQKGQSLSNQNRIAELYLHLGNFYKDNHLNDSAFYYYLKAEKILLRTRNIQLLANVYLNKSTVQIDVFDVFGAEKSAVESLKFSKLIGDRLGEYDAIINLGISANSSEDYKKSNLYYNKAIDLIRKYNISKKYFLREIALNNIGNNYLLLKDYKMATNQFNMALKNNKISKGNPRLYSTIIDNLAYSEFKINGVNEKSHRLFLESLRIKENLKLYNKIIYTKNHLSEFYWHKNEKDLAKRYANEALSLSRKTGNLQDILLSLKQMSIVDLVNYPRHMKEYVIISDSLYRKHRIARNKFAVIAYETEEITNEKDQAIYQKRVFLGIAILVFIIGALVALLLIQRSKQKELRFLQEQQKTNEEIYQLIQNQQARIDEARRVEKKRIAQDLHDGIMNRLSSTRLNLHILNEKSSPDIIRKCLPFIAGIQDIEKEIRNISHDLNKDALFNKVSFVAVLEAFVEEQKTLFSGNFHLEIDKDINWNQLSSFQKIHIFRILQEAIQNTIKHAQAKNIIISFLRNKDQILLEIFDDGNGFSLKQKKKGIGLQNIFSRAKQCNGTAEINTDKSSGTTIRITIPLDPKL